MKKHVDRKIFFPIIIITSSSPQTASAPFLNKHVCLHCSVVVFISAHGTLLISLQILGCSVL